MKSLLLIVSLFAVSGVSFGSENMVGSEGSLCGDRMTKAVAVKVKAVKEVKTTGANEVE